MPNTPAEILRNPSGAASLKVGQRAEVKVAKCLGKESTWAPCHIESAGAQPDTYDVLVGDGPDKHQR
eukprot:CAMPEP_0175687788 /NCGR_PEP_ID=MMETSP0097-20121207/28551_1 /TAXON_ID=311494 /ORGANISM="Alexandrium monilatum, Strain CCMP3105" /LENGTH=66 /DNA_ID=CAMNT_0016994795 /DNA_START=1 /DNA_END=198 /DNA_ORIENTATION=-